jgi:hypothetical protein
VKIIKEHTDHRGSLLIAQIGDMEVLLQERKAGSYGGGEYHDMPQWCLVISGEANVSLKDMGIGNAPNMPSTFGEGTTKFKAGSIITIPAGVIHLFHFPVDTVMVEWHEAGRSTVYYPPWREKCETKK